MKPRLLTIAAELAEDLTEADYRAIYDELREKCSLRAFAEFISSEVTYAWWGRYENGLAKLNHERRNELRKVVGLPLLPYTVAQSLANVSPNAAVWALGEQPAERVVMVGADQPQTLTMRLNGALTVIEDAPQEARVMGLTRPKTRRAHKTVNLSTETWPQHGPQISGVDMGATCRAVGGVVDAVTLVITTPATEAAPCASAQ